MDPNEALFALVVAFTEGDLDEAADNYVNLRGWIARGGFTPDRNTLTDNLRGYAL